MKIETEFNPGQEVYFLNREGGFITKGMIRAVKVKAYEKDSKNHTEKPSIEYLFWCDNSEDKIVPERLVGASADMVAQKLLATAPDKYFDGGEKEGV